MESYQVTEFSMPYLTGAMFFVPMVISVWLLQRTPPPSAEDVQQRSKRPVMTKKMRWSFFKAYAPGLVALIGVYIMLTVVRTLRDDFGVEIWQALGISEQPAVFGQSETLVAVIATALNGLTFRLRRNLVALNVALGLVVAGFGLVVGSTLLQWSGSISPFTFMVACGIGLYIPYVAYHTTIFERLIAASDRVANIGFLMYLADAIGYLGYATVVLAKLRIDSGTNVFPFFQGTLIATSIASSLAIGFALIYFRGKLMQVQEQEVAT